MIGQKIKIAVVIVILCIIFAGSILCIEMFRGFEAFNFCENRGFDMLDSHKDDYIICKSYDVVDNELIEIYEKFNRSSRGYIK